MLASFLGGEKSPSQTQGHRLTAGEVTWGMATDFREISIDLGGAWGFPPLIPLWAHENHDVMVFLDGSSGVEESGKLTVVLCLCQNVGYSPIKADGHHPPIVRAHNISIESGIPFMMVGWPGAPFTLMLLNHGTYANLWGQGVIAIRHKFAKHNSVGKPCLNHLHPWVVPCWGFPYPGRAQNSVLL